MMAERSSRESERAPQSHHDRRICASIAASVAAVTIVALLGAQDARAALSLTTTATPSFSVTLHGVDQTPTYALPMTVSDSTGTGAGWNLTITSTQFSTGGATPFTLPTTASSITGVTSTCAVTPCTDPVNTIAVPVAVPAGAPPPTAVKFFNAQTNSGMGQFTVTATVSVSVPANTFAGTYTSTVTLNIATGP